MSLLFNMVYGLVSILKKRCYFDNKDLYSQSYGFSSGHVWMWELDHKEGWAQKNRCFWTVVLEKTLESLLDCKEIQPVHPKGDQSWVFIGRTDAEAETPILWPPDAKSWLIRKDSDAGKDWGQEEKGTTENEIVGWHHRFNGHAFEEAPGDGEGQRGLAYCSPRGHKESDMARQQIACFFLFMWLLSLSIIILWPADVVKSFPCGSADKKSSCNVGSLDSIPGLGRSPGEGKGCLCSILAWRIPWNA